MTSVNPIRLERGCEKYLRFDTHRQKIYQGAIRAFFDIGHENVKYARMLILKPPKTGRYYRIPGRKRLHRASAPGEAPANLTGRLRRGVGFDILGDSQMEFGDRVFYGQFLELGTYRMKPRPHLIRAVKRNERYAEQRLGLEGIISLEK